MANIPHIPVVSHHHYGHSRPMTEQDFKILISLGIVFLILSVVIFLIYLVQEKFNFKYAYWKFINIDQPFVFLVINVVSGIIIFLMVLSILAGLIMQIIFK
jgi:hypothetical protein